MAWDRRDYFWNHHQVLLVEEVVPYHSLHMRDLSPGAARMNLTVTLSVEEAKDRGATWVKEAIFYSLGRGRVLQWLDRLLINPIFQLGAGYRGNRVFRRLQAILEKPHADIIGGPPRRNTKEHDQGESLPDLDSQEPPVR